MLSRIHAHWASEPYKTFQHAIAACAALLLIFAALVKIGNLPLFARAVVGIVEGRTITAAAPQWALVIAASTFALEISVGIALLLAPSETVALWATVTREECNSMFYACTRSAQNTTQLNDCYIQRSACYAMAEQE